MMKDLIYLINLNFNNIFNQLHQLQRKDKYDIIEGIVKKYNKPNELAKELINYINRIGKEKRLDFKSNTLNQQIFLMHIDK